ncbi:hypothetical protein [Terrihabitans sp. B22-R8]|uniref:hypothetical protein n=1 Tax=Terrihabitans sp. B22-R8 TaxID=3425128 RepID=UPI00403D46C2
MNAKKAGFSGSLAAPIERDLPAYSLVLEAAENEQRHAKWSESIFHERLGKLPLLFDHYGLSPSESSWPALVLALACDTVPGFQLALEGPASQSFPDLAASMRTAPKPQGRPKGSSPHLAGWSDGMLAAAMQVLEARSFTKEEAAKALAISIHPGGEHRLDEEGRNELDQLAKTLANRVQSHRAKSPEN